MIALDGRRAIHRRALAWTGAQIAAITPADLDRPTPCTAWSLRDLVGHMTSHNRGFTLALSGTPEGAEIWDNLDPGSDAAKAYEATSGELTAAFAGETPQRIEVYGYGTFGIMTVIGMHIIDVVAHGWDVARALGLDRMPDDDLCEAAYEIMRGFPDERPNQAFDVVVPVPDDAPIGPRLMGWLGRDPGWQPS